MIRDIESGDVWVNALMQTRFELPFGGIKESGCGHDSVLDFTREKARSSRCQSMVLRAAIGSRCRPFGRNGDHKADRWRHVSRIRPLSREQLNETQAAIW